jgi:hypothetical protein
MQNRHHSLTRQAVFLCLQADGQKGVFPRQPQVNDLIRWEIRDRGGQKGIPSDPVVLAVSVFAIYHWIRFAVWFFPF